MGKKQNHFIQFGKWVVGNTAWDYFKRGISFILSLGATRWAFIRPSVIEWFNAMDIPLIIAITTMFIGCFVVVFGGVSLSNKVWKSFFSRQQSNSNLQFKIRKEGYEIFIDVKNKSWFVDFFKLRVMYDFLDERKNRELISYSFDWIQGSNKSGEVFLKRRETKTIHFATIKQLQKEYDMHLIERDLSAHFENDRGIRLRVEGLTSAGAKKYFKKDVSGMLLMSESISKGLLNFEIDNFLKMGAES